MVKKSEHPDIQLFDYLNGTLDAEAAQIIEAHMSICDHCRSVVALVRALRESASASQNESRSQISDLESQVSGEHPAVSELASFFYASSPRADRSQVAAHVALCRSCAEEISQYSRAERASYRYKPAKASQVEVPAKAWGMINDWEASSLAKFKPASEVLGQELLGRLSHFLSEREVGVEVSDYKEERVPVLIVSSAGNVRSVEFFERVVDSTGSSILRHSEGSERFDNKPIHMLLDFGEERVIISDLIRSDIIRLQQPPRTDRQPRRADYFIIEDSKD